MRIGSYRVEADWGHLALLLCMVAFCLWYLSDAMAASRNIQNLLLIVPAVACALLLAAVLFLHSASVAPAGDDGPPAASQGIRGMLRANSSTLLLLALLGGYVFSMEAIGFDLATFLFVAGGLAVQGERRPIVLVGFSLVFAVLVTAGFKMMLTVAVPTRFW